MSDLIKKFFDTFKIEPKFKGYSDTEELSNGSVIPCGNIKYFNTIEEMDKANYWCFNMWELNEEDKEYPQITDRILLELICICNNTYINGYTNYFTSCGKTVEEIKKEILKKCIFLQDDIKQQVQELFKGE